MWISDDFNIFLNSSAAVSFVSVLIWRNEVWYVPNTFECGSVGVFIQHGLDDSLSDIDHLQHNVNPISRCNQTARKIPYDNTGTEKRADDCRFLAEADRSDQHQGGSGSGGQIIPRVPQSRWERWGWRLHRELSFPASHYLLLFQRGKIYKSNSRLLAAWPLILLDATMAGSQSVFALAKNTVGKNLTFHVEKNR